MLQLNLVYNLAQKMLYIKVQLFAFFSVFTLKANDDT